MSISTVPPRLTPVRSRRSGTVEAGAAFATTVVKRALSPGQGQMSSRLG